MVNMRGADGSYIVRLILQPDSIILAGNIRATKIVVIDSCSWATVVREELGTRHRDLDGQPPTISPRSPSKLFVGDMCDVELFETD